MLRLVQKIFFIGLVQDRVVCIITLLVNRSWQLLPLRLVQQRCVPMWKLCWMRRDQLWSVSLHIWNVSVIHYVDAAYDI